MIPYVHHFSLALHVLALLLILHVVVPLLAAVQRLERRAAHRTVAAAHTHHPLPTANGREKRLERGCIPASEPNIA